VNTLPVSGDLSAAVGPVKCLLQGLSGLFRSIGAAFKDKKRWIPALILGLVWFALTLLPLLGVNPLPVRWISFLSFAGGGTSGGITGLVGGIVGKGVFAYFLMSLVIPLTRGQKPFAGIAGGFKRFFPAFGTKGTTQSAHLLAGMGAALVFYNFITGTASLVNSMAGVAALLLSLRALSGKAGFLRRFLGALITKKTAKGSANTEAVNRIIAGMAAGFALAIALSAIPFAYIGYAAGAAALAAAIVLKIVPDSKKEATV